MGTDIIGDIHGHADKLEALLAALGYAERGGAWRHPSRSVVFVGDLIDRGPGQLRTLELVRGMIDAGSARCVMGNHELNAIGWATPDPGREGDYLRRRLGASGENHRRQHDAFLTEVGADGPLHQAWVKWLLELPLWIEEPGFRVVHACWDPRAVEAVRPHLRYGERLQPDALPHAYRRGEAFGDGVEVLLKGPEVRLPHGLTFADKGGHVRSDIRTRWWAPELHTYRDAYIGPDGVDIPAEPLPHADTIPQTDRPTFIGHYWLNPAEAGRPLTSKVACVDYSVAMGGPLVAYRFDGETSLSASKFVCV